jgi:hypothetical protein
LVVPGKVAFQDHENHALRWLSKPFQRGNRHM